LNFEIFQIDIYLFFDFYRLRINLTHVFKEFKLKQLLSIHFNFKYLEKKIKQALYFKSKLYFCTPFLGGGMYFSLINGCF